MAVLVSRNNLKKRVASIASLPWTLFTSLLTHRLVLLCSEVHCFILWDLPGGVLAAPESALGLDRCKTSLSLSLSTIQHRHERVVAVHRFQSEESVCDSIGCSGNWTILCRGSPGVLPGMICCIGSRTSSVQAGLVNLGCVLTRSSMLVGMCQTLVYAGYSALLCAPIVIGYSQHDMFKMTPGKGTSQVPDR